MTEIMPFPEYLIILPYWSAACAGGPSYPCGLRRASARGCQRLEGVAQRGGRSGPVGAEDHARVFVVLLVAEAVLHQLAAGDGAARLDGGEALVRREAVGLRRVDGRRQPREGPSRERPREAVRLLNEHVKGRAMQEMKREQQRKTLKQQPQQQKKSAGTIGGDKKRKTCAPQIRGRRSLALFPLRSNVS